MSILVNLLDSLSLPLTLQTLTSGFVVARVVTRGSQRYRGDKTPANGGVQTRPIRNGRPARITREAFTERRGGVAGREDTRQGGGSSAERRSVRSET